MKRICDQILILSAIKAVRSELREDMSPKEMWDVMVRLGTLYSLLNPDQLIDACASDINSQREERKAA